MQVFLQIKDYEAFFDRMLTEKKYNEVINLIHYLKDDRELEIEFKNILKTESDFMNILFFIQAFWSNSVKSKKSNNDLTSFNILIEIFNIFLRENISFSKICKKHPCLLNLINLICIKYSKITKNFEKIKHLIDIIIDKFYYKIDKRLLCESLRNEGFLDESFYYSSILNVHLNYGTSFELNEINKIFDKFDLNLNENLNEDSILKYSKMDTNNKLDRNSLNIDNDKNWNNSALLNNKNLLKKKNSEQSINHNQIKISNLNNLIFLNDSNSNNNRTYNKINNNDDICKDYNLRSNKILIINNINVEKYNMKKNFNNKRSNIYNEYFSKVLEPIKLPIQINMRDV